MDYENVTFATFHPKYGFVHIVLTAVLLGLIIVCTVIGNMFVVAAILLDRNLQRVSNYLILSLAIADLMVATLVMPMSALHEVSDKWWLGVSLCDIWIVMDVLCCTASILHLVAIAIDRYWAITRLNYVRSRTTKPILCMIAIVWVTALAISLPTRFHQSRNEYQVLVQGQCQINDEYAFTIFSTVGAFYLPMTFLIGVYAKIYQAAQKRIRKRRFRTVPMNAVAPSCSTTVKQGNGVVVNRTNKSLKVTMQVQMTCLRTKLSKFGRFKTVVSKETNFRNKYTDGEFYPGFQNHCEDFSERDMSLTFNDDLSPTSNNSSSYCSSFNHKSSSNSGTCSCHLGIHSPSPPTIKTPTKITYTCQPISNGYSNTKKLTCLGENDSIQRHSSFTISCVLQDRSNTTPTPAPPPPQQQNAYFSSDNLHFSYENTQESLINRKEMYVQDNTIHITDPSSVEDTFSLYSSITDDQDRECEILPCSVSHSDVSTTLKHVDLTDSDGESVSNTSNADQRIDQTEYCYKMPIPNASFFYEYKSVSSPFLIEFSPSSSVLSSKSSFTLHNSTTRLSTKPCDSGTHRTTEPSLHSVEFKFPTSPYVGSGQNSSSLQSVNISQFEQILSQSINSSSPSDLILPRTLDEKGELSADIACDVQLWVDGTDSDQFSILMPESCLKLHDPQNKEKQNPFQYKEPYADIEQSHMCFDLSNLLETDTLHAVNVCGERISNTSDTKLNRPTTPTAIMTPELATRTTSPKASTNLTMSTANIGTFSYDRINGDRSYESEANNFIYTNSMGNNALLEAEHHRERIESRRERKAARTVAIITGCFILCWLPFFVRALYAPFCMPTCPLPDWVESLLLWLGYLNSLLNPILYTVFSPDFRNAFKKIVCGRLSIRAN